MRRRQRKQKAGLLFLLAFFVFMYVGNAMDWSLTLAHWTIGVGLVIWVVFVGILIFMVIEERILHRSKNDRGPSMTDDPEGGSE